MKIMKWSGCLLALAVAAGCSEEAKPTPATNTLVVQPELTATSTGQATSAGATACQPGLVGFTGDSSWKARRDGTWDGAPLEVEPKEMKAIANSELLRVAMDGTGDQRDHALVSVGRRRLPGAMDAFSKAMVDSNITTRQAALAGLIEHGGPDALPLIWEMFRDEQVPRVKADAMWGVALYGPSQATKVISEAQQAKEPHVQGQAIAALITMRDRPELVMPLLTDALDSEEKLVWQEALQVLSSMPYSDAANMLERAARQAKSTEFRDTATWAYRRWHRQFPDLCK